MSSDTAARCAFAAPDSRARGWSIVERWPALAVMALGLVVLYTVGFSPLPIAHSAAHDTRHANGFPCH